MPMPNALTANGPPDLPPPPMQEMPEEGDGSQVTPPMVQAGVEALMQLAQGGEGAQPEQIVTAVYEAMSAAEGQPPMPKAPLPPPVGGSGVNRPPRA